MPPRKQADQPPPRVTLTERKDKVLVAARPRKVIRFLLSDGRTVDVDTDQDDSDVREAVRKHTGAERIEGSVVLP